MNILHLVLSHYWALPFALALLLRDRHQVAAVATAIAPALVGFNLGGDARLATACVIALGIALSLALGRVVRAALPSMSPRARTRAVTALAALCILALLPASMATAFAALAHVATVKMRHWDARMPARACLARRYPVTVAGAVYNLPAAPVITVRTAGRSYHFQYGSSLRQACEQAGERKKPIHATDVNLDFTIPMAPAFCHAADDPWVRQLCDGPSVRDAFPAMVNIYARDEYDRQHLMPPPSYGRFLDAQKKAGAAGHALTPQPDGIFDRYAGGYWVARDGAWKNDAGEPYTLHCQSTDTPGRLSCETTYRLKSGPEITCRFSAPASALGQAAKSADAGLHAMLEDFAAPAAPQAAKLRPRG